MKIATERAMRFGELKPGDVYLLGLDYYMKTSTGTDKANTVRLSDDTSNTCFDDVRIHPRPNALLLPDGKG